MKLNIKAYWPYYLIVLGVTVVFTREAADALRSSNEPYKAVMPDHWVAPSLYVDNTLKGAEREQVIYGEDLIRHTSVYFGPKGNIAQQTNGLNCQNCHLQAGKQAWGNNYGAVASTYPKWRARSNSTETIPKRVNDCFERSLNGKALDTNSREMMAIVAYITWLGKDVAKGEKPVGSGITDLPFLDRAADVQKGARVYVGKCQSCHGNNGEGLMDPSGLEYVYPPLWGANSYNSGAGLFRLSRFAGYVSDNMPFNQATHQAPSLTNAEAWDVAAFVNSQPRPSMDLKSDWPDISKKPIDHPFGPYADGFNEHEHKYGPFKPIAEAVRSKKPN